MRDDARFVRCTAARISAALLTLGLAAAPAQALTDAQHREMLRASRAYAHANGELNRAWYSLRAALTAAGLQEHFEGTLPHPHPSAGGLLDSQRTWLRQWRDSEAEQLRGSGSVADGYAAATRKRAAWMRERAEALRAFAALRPPADAPLKRLLKEQGGSVRFVECRSSGQTPQQQCAGERPVFYGYVELSDSGQARIGITGRPDNPPGRWKLAPDGSVHAAWWEFVERYTLHDGRYLKGASGSFVLDAPEADAAPARIHLNPDAPSYTNARFGFAVVLPPGQWEVREAEGGDGITARDDESDANSREIRVYGTNSPGVLGQDFAAMLAEAEGGFANVTRRETDTTDAAHSRFTLAGTAKAGGLLYVRGFVGAEVANIARISAPDGWREGFDVAVRAVEASFKPGF